MQEARHPRCLVLGVDTPLVPVSALAHLCRLHQQGVTVLECRGHQEPLIGVYDSHLSSAIEPLIVDYGAPVWTLEHQTTWQTFSYQGPEVFLKNCNTPRDYAAICDTMDSYIGCGITLL